MKVLEITEGRRYFFVVMKMSARELEFIILKDAFIGILKFQMTFWNICEFPRNETFLFVV